MYKSDIVQRPVFFSAADVDPKVIHKGALLGT